MEQFQNIIRRLREDTAIFCRVPILKSSDVLIAAVS